MSDINLQNIKKFNIVPGTYIEYKPNSLNPDYIFRNGDYEYVKYMLDNGYNPNYSLGYETPLMIAMSNKENIKIINLLLEYGADINKCDNKGWTPLMTSIFCGKQNIMKFFLEKGADPNKSGNQLNCLFLVCNKMLFNDWNLDSFKLLLNYGMNPNYNISTIFNLLMSDNEAQEFVKLLIDHGLNTRMKYDKKSVLDFLKENNWFESTQLLKNQELLNENYTKIFNKISIKSNKINYKPTSIRTQILLLKLDIGINNNDFDYLKSKYNNLFDYFGIYDLDSMYTKLNNSSKYIN
ncbi:ankyrin repeat protein [Acanthamoeba polyphaga moumouvirus]|uniref:Ankyrin repeat protein n=1 Tax=Acanthamoeba polyphaga moumouvirus TaxID=1269028 RepID=L7RCF9_9VIRU|nr:ankyrin repeat protein [Acanthamoeba polyphaga moumouvirus]AGC01921.1 ankyrin repeat protein [Acanthamoeba polyphaga moumouvirus]AQN68282.1 ankyrin repeat protein [Saudi moumouvirus]